MKKSALAAALTALALAACGDKPAEPAAASEPAASAVAASVPAEASAPAAASAPSASAPAAEQPASDAAPEPAPAASEPAGTESEPEPAPAAAAGKLVEACEAYFVRVERCLSKIDASIAASFSAENTRLKESLAQSPAADQAAACKMANDQFDQSAKALNCE